MNELFFMLVGGNTLKQATYSYHYLHQGMQISANIHRDMWLVLVSSTISMFEL